MIRNQIRKNSRERIIELMKREKIYSAPDLARAMIGKGIVQTKRPPKEAIRYTADAINSHIKKKGFTAPDRKWIERYCDFFNCSADYLLGYIDRPTHQLQSVGDVTGLSDEVITALSRYNDETKDLLHNMITADGGDLLSGLLSSMFLYCAGHVHDLKAYDLYGDVIPLEREEMDAMTKFQATDFFSHVLRQLYNDYYDYREEILQNQIDLLKAQIKLQELQGLMERQNHNNCDRFHTCKIMYLCYNLVD